MPAVDSHSIRISASTEELSRARAFIADFASQHSFSQQVTHEVQMAVDEACTNVIKHAYEFDNNREINLSISYLNNKLVIKIIDDGKSFDPSVYTKPDLEKRIKSRQRGGFGIYLIRSFMDEVEYANENGLNQLRMVRKM